MNKFVLEMGMVFSQIEVVDESLWALRMIFATSQSGIFGFPRKIYLFLFCWRSSLCVVLTFSPYFHYVYGKVLPFLHVVEP